MWRMILGLMGFLFATSPAMSLEHAPDDIERGHAALARARREPSAQRRETYLSEAVAAFAAAYEIGGQQSKGQALIGAAQGYLLMQKAPARFPFFWSAPPLQRAYKSLQQVLAFQPDHRAANLLMGLVLWRQAMNAPERGVEARQRSLTYLQRAAELGLPVQPTSEPRAGSSPRQFTVGDRIVALRQVDARGVGTLQDTLFVYCLAPNADQCYGVVAGAETTHPLHAEPTMDVIVPGDVLDVRIVAPPRPEPHRIVVIWQRRGQPAETSFVWQAAAFVPARSQPGPTHTTQR